MNDTSPAIPRVLVVDDQAPNVRLLEAILAPRGYDVRTASSGEEALAALDQDDVDLLRAIASGDPGPHRRVRVHPLGGGGPGEQLEEDLEVVEGGQQLLDPHH